MAATVREAIRELLEQTIATAEALLDATDEELPMPSSHVCAQGKDAWALITNDIDHEKIHSGQVFEARYEAAARPPRWRASSPSGWRNAPASSARSSA